MNKIKNLINKIKFPLLGIISVIVSLVSMHKSLNIISWLYFLTGILLLSPEIIERIFSRVLKFTVGGYEIHLIHPKELEDLNEKHTNALTEKDKQIEVKVINYMEKFDNYDKLLDAISSFSPTLEWHLKYLCFNIHKQDETNMNVYELLDTLSCINVIDSSAHSVLNTVFYLSDCVKGTKAMTCNKDNYYYKFYEEKNLRALVEAMLRYYFTLKQDFPILADMELK